MARPLSSKTIKEFLETNKFSLEPVYVSTPDGYVLELTRMSFITMEDGDDADVFPIFVGQYTDMTSFIESSTGELGSDLPPS